MAPTNTSPKAGVHSRHPWTPPYGSGSLRSASYFRRAKSRPVSVLFSAHWGLLPSKFVSAYFYRTPPPASLPVWCGRHQLPSCHGYTRVGGARIAQTLLNFCPVGTCAPEARRTQGRVLGRRIKLPIPQEGVSRKMGAWGQAAYERPLREGAHRRRPRRIFGYFLCEQKVTILRF